MWWGHGPGPTKTLEKHSTGPKCDTFRRLTQRVLHNPSPWGSVRLVSVMGQGIWGPRPPIPLPRAGGDSYDNFPSPHPTIRLVQVVSVSQTWKPTRMSSFRRGRHDYSFARVVSAIRPSRLRGDGTGRAGPPDQDLVISAHALARTATRPPRCSGPPGPGWFGVRGRIRQTPPPTAQWPSYHGQRNGRGMVYNTVRATP
jgi:hypothetical protein